MILDVDIGNTRSKWRMSGAGGDRVISSVGRDEPWSHAFGCVAVAPSRVRASCVGGAERLSALAAFSLSRWGIALEVAKVESGNGGVTCGYHETERLGVDRWLAILAAHSRFRRDVWVVDAGTAITLDFVSAAGEHSGGYIMPGLSLMRQSLALGTIGVGAHQEVSPERLRPGRNTRDAVALGALLAAVGGIAEACRTTAASACVVLTGGDAALLAPLLPMSSEVVEGLVLDGLQVAMP